VGVASEKVAFFMGEGNLCMFLSYIRVLFVTIGVKRGGGGEFLTNTKVTKAKRTGRGVVRRNVSS
jgi:hypothetical protein